MDRAVAICFVGSAVDQAGNNFLVTVGNTGWPDYRFRVTQMSLTESGSSFVGVPYPQRLTFAVCFSAKTFHSRSSSGPGGGTGPGPL